RCCWILLSLWREHTCRAIPVRPRGLDHDFVELLYCLANNQGLARSILLGCADNLVGAVPSLLSRESLLHPCKSFDVRASGSLFGAEIRNSHFALRPSRRAVVPRSPNRNRNDRHPRTSSLSSTPIRFVPTPHPLCNPCHLHFHATLVLRGSDRVRRKRGSSPIAARFFGALLPIFNRMRINNAAGGNLRAGGGRSRGQVENRKSHRT